MNVALGVGGGIAAVVVSGGEAPLCAVEPDSSALAVMGGDSMEAGGLEAGNRFDTAIDHAGLRQSVLQLLDVGQ